MRKRRGGGIGWTLVVLVVMAVGLGYVATRWLGVTIPGAPTPTGPIVSAMMPPTASSSTPMGPIIVTATPLPGSGPQVIVVPNVPQPPSPMPIANDYVAAWAQRRYADMYALLSPASKATIDERKFVGRYSAIYGAATVVEVRVTAGTAQMTALPNTARIPCEVVLKTVRLGEIRETQSVPLVYEDGRWGIVWNPSLILKDLTGDNLVRMAPQNPQRGSILDRKGRPLAVQAYMIQVGVIPGDIKNEAVVLKALTDYTKVPADDIKKKYQKAEPDWFVPIKDIPIAQEADARSKLDQVEGVMLRHKAMRSYPNGDLAAHVIGYVSKITAEDLSKLAEKGYDADDYVGREGVEVWGEEDLAGQRGGKLTIVTPQGELVKVVAEQQVKRGNDVYLSIDIDVQRMAEQVLADKPGSIVVLDPRDNSVLALATSPRFDPNKFVAGYSEADWDAVMKDAKHPLLNRPVMSAYATGSIFKVITFSAAMEKLGYKADTQVACPGLWQIPGTNISLRDWKPEGHGVLPFTQALTESCNGPFYDIGFKLNAVDPLALPAWTRNFGLGQKTGIVGVPESPGILPDPAWKLRVIGQAWFPGDAVNLAIGQGFFQATALQMANVYSTLAVKGLVRTPVLVQRINTVEGQLVKAFAADERERLPAQPATLAAIHAGMLRVGSTPEGTGYYAFQGFKTPMASKTGSAENQNPEAHAWFAGYAPAENPEVVVIVMMEGGGAGGSVAAPRARQMMDFLFPPSGATPVPTVTPAPGAVPTPRPAGPTPSAVPAQPPAQPTTPAKPATPPTPVPTAKPAR